MKFRELKHLPVVALVAVGLAVAACGGGGSSTQAPPPPQPEPTAYERATAAIAAADTAAGAQAAYDAVKDEVTAAQGESLQMKVDDRIMAINTAARIAAQKMALMTAAGMIDTSDLSTQELVDAANAAIRGLRQALEDAADVSDADKAMYMSRLDTAVAAVDTAQGGIDTATRRTNQMTALSGASTTLQAALAALSGATPTQALLDAANSALTALNAAITGGADLTDDEKAPYQREAASASAPIQTAQMAFDDAQDADKAARDKAMMATAKKLLDGIGKVGREAGDAGTAAYGSDSNANAIAVTLQGGSAVNVPEDKKTTVAAHHGWTGKRYAHTVPSNAGDMYEAVVYSNVGEPTQGAKFSTLYSENFNATTGVLNETTTEGTASRVASSSFDQSAGVKSFEKGSNAVAVMISGTYHGVAGTYSCVPGNNANCASQVAAEGFTLGSVSTAQGTLNQFTAGGATWTFKPTNAAARVMSTPDAIYASYGWWLHKSANGKTYKASAFVADRGNVTDAAGLDRLNGKATYRGGAAGKYALHSTTGGTNDAGHFTARATLNADFSDNSITGTIDNFMGVGGAKNWSVELKEAALSSTGMITGTGEGRADNATVWTIGGTAAVASGEWSGSLQDNDAAGVPKVGTGTFYTEYGDDGKMVGAFGVNKQ